MHSRFDYFRGNFARGRCSFRERVSRRERSRRGCDRRNIDVNRAQIRISATEMHKSRDGDLMPFYSAMPSARKLTGSASRYGPEAVIKMRGAREACCSI